MAHYTRYVWKVKVDSHGSWSQVFSKTPALDTTKVYWARRRGEHSRLERTAKTRAEVRGGGGGEEAAVAAEVEAEVEADLVGAPGNRLRLNQRRMCKALDDTEFSD